LTPLTPDLLLPLDETRATVGRGTVGCVRADRRFDRSMLGGP
jgi:hypothetical protein